MTQLELYATPRLVVKWWIQVQGYSSSSIVQVQVQPLVRREILRAKGSSSRYSLSQA